jgi:cytochrome oxidase Cu insertion factor (SCO1/SenC/PrrC family)
MRFLALGAAFLAVSSLSAQSPHRRPVEGKLKVSDMAPPLSAVELHSGQEVRLADLRGKPVVLIFGSCT